MKLINLSDSSSIPNKSIRESVAAIGFFDGIHKGHQAVIRQAVNRANETGMESVVITFHPHPLVILKKSKQAAKYLTPAHEKKRLLSDLGVDRVYVIEFTKQLSLLSPEQFVNTYIKRLNVKHLIAGFDFTFGHKGAGNMNNLYKFAKDDFTFDIVNKVACENKEISSTRIRQLLDEGNVQKANQLLGRQLTLTGVVGDGDKRGRKIGFPTANLILTDNYYLPKIGAYAVEVYVKGKKYIGMANLGVVPTFNKGDEKVTLEVHILNFDQTIYSEEVTLKWIKFIRDEKKFASVDELIEQLNRDKQFVEQLFKTKVT